MWHLSDGFKFAFSFRGGQIYITLKCRIIAKKHLHIKSLFLCLMFQRALGEWVKTLWRCSEVSCISFTCFCGRKGERINLYPPSSNMNVNKVSYFTILEGKEHNSLMLHLCNSAVKALPFFVMGFINAIPEMWYLNRRVKVNVNLLHHARPLWD